MGDRAAWLGLKFIDCCLAVLGSSLLNVLREDLFFVIKWFASLKCKPRRIVVVLLWVEQMGRDDDNMVGVGET